MKVKLQVKYSYLREQFGQADHTLAAIQEELQRGQFTLGPAVAELEARFAQLCQTKYAVGVNSGTDSLFPSLKALGIGPGDEVITAPNSFIATAAAIANTGARPVFVDVDDDYNINPDLIERAITPRTRALLPVHLTGNPADMPRIVKIAQRHGLHVVEDACQAVNAAIHGQPVGSFGMAGCFSLHPLKNLNVWGDGGVIVANSRELYDRLMLLRNHGLRNRDDCDLFAYNSRLDTVQALVALGVMKDLEAITDSRIRHARFYDQALQSIEGLCLPPRREGVRQVYHTYVVQARHRDRLLAYLTENGVEAKVHYPIPIHLQKASQALGYGPGDFPVSEAQARSIITLPVHQYLTERELAYVAEQIREFYGLEGGRAG